MHNVDTLRWLLLLASLLAAFSTYQWLRPVSNAVIAYEYHCAMAVGEVVLPLGESGFHSVEGLENFSNFLGETCDPQLASPLSTNLWFAYNRGKHEGVSLADDDWNTTLSDSCDELNRLHGEWLMERLDERGWISGEPFDSVLGNCSLGLYQLVRESRHLQRGQECERIRDELDAFSQSLEDGIASPVTYSSLFRSYQSQC